MKKLITLLGLVAITQFASAATYKDNSLLSGWNLYVGITNGIVAPGVTNVEFTSVEGQILYSLTNNTVNGVQNTNLLTADAFNTDGVLLPSDLNGDFVANTAVHWAINNTNLIPVAITNSQGQWFVYSGNTNGLPSGQTYPATGWPLFSTSYPQYMYPATTNLYPYPGAIAAPASAVISLQRGWSFPQGGKSYTFWDTSTNVFQFTVTNNSLATGFNGVTNLPTSFTQGASKVRVAAIVCSTNSLLFNALSVGAPIP